MRKILQNMKKHFQSLVNPSLILTLPLLISLTVAISSCKSAPEVPKPPRPSLKQPLIDVEVCENGQCKTISVCKIWKLTDKDEWVLSETIDLKLCNGTFGVTSKEFLEIRDYSRKLSSWIGQNCGSSDNK